MCCHWTIPHFSDSIDLIYPHKLDIKDTSDSMNSATYLDLQIEYDDQGKLNYRLFMECIFHNLFIILEPLTL